MTPFLMLTFVMAALTIGWLTRPLWLHANTGGAMPTPSARHPLAMTAALATGVLAVAGIGYAWLGAPEHLATGPAASVSAANLPTSARDARSESPARGPDADALAQAEARVTTMIDSLAQRLKTRPDDADGWQTLARSNAALGRHAAAVEAFKTALRLRPNSATLLAEYAFSASVLDPHAASGEPARLIERALQLDPENPKALALAGTLALDRKDYPAAVAYWEHLARIEPADGPIAKQLQFSILQARQLAGTQVAALAPALIPTTTATGAAAHAQVGGTLTLAPALLAHTSPEDTVFIFARSVGGPRMPLAVLRKQVKDLPLHFTLDDSLAMSPAATLSKAESVIVGARISKSGNAVAHEGDLQGQLPPMALGRTDLKLEINEVVKLH